MNLLLRSEVGAAQSGQGEDKWYNDIGHEIFIRWRISFLTLPWSPYLSSTPINASPITAAASYRLPMNSCSSSENASSYLA